ncbi:MAG TPA: response regulator [Bacteroidota bacterium]|nr:response regulator [Bacteroidota bacterium]
MILIIEDDEIMRSLLKTFLLGAGYEVMSTVDGIEGVDAYETNKRNIQLVVSDLQMPNLNGVGAFRKIKAMNPDVKVIFVSGYIDPHLQRQLQSEGVQKFIRKPYSPDEILGAVREALGRPPELC